MLSRIHGHCDAPRIYFAAHTSGLFGLCVLGRVLSRIRGLCLCPAFSHGCSVVGFLALAGFRPLSIAFTHSRAVTAAAFSYLRTVRLLEPSHSRASRVAPPSHSRAERQHSKHLRVSSVRRRKPCVEPHSIPGPRLCNSRGLAATRPMLQQMSTAPLPSCP